MSFCQVGVDEHQMSDHPSTFMRMVKGRSHAIAAPNDKTHQVQRSRVIWHGSIDCFEDFRNNKENHYGQFVAGNLFDTNFLTTY